MCNYLHKNSQPIPKNGEGWKIFSVRKDGSIKGSTYGVYYLKKNQNKYVKWKNIGDGFGGVGFCFFLNEEIGKLALTLWSVNFPYINFVLLPIRYKQGLGKHEETSFVSEPVEIALCKEFAIDPEYKFTKPNAQPDPC